MEKEHAISLHIHRLDQERKELKQKQTETRIEANELEKQTISKEAAKESLTGFTDRYRSLSPYDKKYLLSQLIHSIIYTNNKITARYYILPDIDVLPISIKKKGDPRGIARRFAPCLQSKQIMIIIISNLNRLFSNNSTTLIAIEPIVDSSR